LPHGRIWKKFSPLFLNILRQKSADDSPQVQNPLPPCPFSTIGNNYRKNYDIFGLKVESELRPIYFVSFFAFAFNLSDYRPCFFIDALPGQIFSILKKFALPTSVKGVRGAPWEIDSIYDPRLHKSIGA